MWCPNCQSGTPSDIHGDGSRLKCVHCGGVVAFPPARGSGGGDAETAGGVRGSATGGRSRDARELLARWSNVDPLDPFGPVGVSKKTAAHEGLKTGSDSSANSGAAAGSKQKPKPQFRIDRAHSQAHQAGGSEPKPIPEQPAVGAHAGSVSAATTRTSSQIVSPPSTGEQRTWRADGAHPLAGWHGKAKLLANQSEQPNASTNWMQAVGQLTAYIGVLGLTVGTAIVLWGYFGGPIELTPTGWLVATVGQMLLFLGVVTLVSGGMEQTAVEVSRRVETLGDRILRIENVTREHLLKGPHFPMTSVAADEGTDAEPGRSTGPASRGESVSS